MRITFCDRKARSISRVADKLGDAQSAEILSAWGNMKTRLGERDHREANGVIVNLICSGLSDIELRSYLNIGSSQYWVSS